MKRVFIPYSINAYHQLKREGNLPALVNSDNLKVLADWGNHYSSLTNFDCLKLLSKNFLPKLDIDIQTIFHFPDHLQITKLLGNTNWSELSVTLHKTVKEILLISNRYKKYKESYYSFAQSYADTLFLLYDFFLKVNDIPKSFWLDEQEKSLSHELVLNNLSSQLDQYNNLYKEYDSLYRLSLESGNIQKLTFDQKERIERLQKLENLFSKQI